MDATGRGAREVVRAQGEVRCYYPDAKLVRVEPGTFRNVFPSLSAEQQESLSRYYDFRVLADDRVGGRPVQVVVFDPRDGLRYGHRFWSDRATGLLLRASVLNERGDSIEQFSFSERPLRLELEHPERVGQEPAQAEGINRADVDRPTQGAEGLDCPIEAGP